jgi:hypothetical protein
MKSIAFWHILMARTGRGLLCSFKVVQPIKVLAEDLPVEKDQRAEGLVLGGGGNLSLDGKMVQELRGKNILPLPIPAGVLILSLQGKRKIHLAKTVLEILLV